MVAPAQASFEEPRSIFGQRILERNQIDEASNDGYAGCGFKLEEHTGALDPMPQKTVNGLQKFGMSSGWFCGLSRLRNPSGMECAVW